MVSIQYLRYFMKICEMHSMNRAAAELFITQPALSLAVKKLEDSLGVTLFVRSNRGIELTQDGETLLRHCLLLMKQLELIENMGQESQKQILSVSAFPYIVPPEVFLKLKEDPACSQLQLEYEECRVLHIFENVAGLVSQLGIIQFNNYQRKLIERKAEDYGLSLDVIAAVRWAVVLGPGSPYYSCREVSFAGLADHRLIRMKDDLFSFLTGELVVDRIVVGDLPYDNVQSGPAAEYLLEHTRSYMLCGHPGPFSGPASVLRAVPLKNCDVEISIAVAVRKNYKPADVEERFLSLLTEALSGYNQKL